MNLRFTPEAESDLIKIEQYLYEKGAYLPDRFVAALFDHLSFIVTNPKVGKLLRNKCRMYFMRSFQYHIVYKEEETELVVVHILHGKRHQKLRISRIK